MSEKEEFGVGSSSVDNFFKWIEDRTSIWYLKEIKKSPKPWTDDPIFLECKFTNAFRQMDRGTIALQKMISGQTDGKLIVFNIMWYRMFNLDVHANNLGFVTSYDQLEEYILSLAEKEEKIFTSAHMTSGVFNEDKHVTYLRACKEIFEQSEEIAKIAVLSQSMEEVFNQVTKIRYIGSFVGYEIACDLRFTVLMSNVKDSKTWGSVGPGAKRGMQRLGFAPTLETMQWLLYEAEQRRLGSIVIAKQFAGLPFEIREIEHSLCEFDKYERVRFEEGRPRQRYNGLNDDPIKPRLSEVTKDLVKMNLRNRSPEEKAIAAQKAREYRAKKLAEGR